MRVGCELPIAIKLRPGTSDGLLAELEDKLADAIARRLAEATHAMSARLPSVPTTVRWPQPDVRFSGLTLTHEERARIESVVRRALRRGIATRGTQDLSASPGFMLVRGGSTVPPADDGIHIAAGQEDSFWKLVRGWLFTRVINDEGISDRNDAIRILMRGIRRPRAQVLIKEALDTPFFQSGVRMEMTFALQKRAKEEPVAWDLLLYGIERPNDFSGYGPFDQGFQSDAGGLAQFLGNVLEHGSDDEKRNAGRAVRYILDQQFQKRMEQHRADFEAFRKLAAKYGLYAKTGLGVDAIRNHIAANIDLVLLSIGAIQDAVHFSPYGTKGDPFRAADETLLVALTTALGQKKAALATMPAEEIDALDTRTVHLVEMTTLLPEILSKINGGIEALGRIIAAGSQSDEIDALFTLRHRFIAAYCATPADDDAQKRFSEAQSDLADLRSFVANVKWERLKAAWDGLKLQGISAMAYYQPTEPGGGLLDDATYVRMRATIHEYIRTFDALFIAPSAGGMLGTGVGVQVTSPTKALNLAQATSVEGDLAIFSVASGLVLFFAIAANLDARMRSERVWTQGWRDEQSQVLLAIRNELAGFFNSEKWAAFAAKRDEFRQRLDNEATVIEAKMKLEARVRVAIVLAASLAAGFAGVGVRLLAGTVVEAAIGAEGLAIASTVAEATAFTGTQAAAEHFVFGKPVDWGEAGKSLAINVAQFGAFRLLGSALGPGPSGRTILAFFVRQGVRVTFAVDIAVLLNIAQTGDLPHDWNTFLVQTIGMYAIGSAFGAWGAKIEEASIKTRFGNYRTQTEALGRRMQAIVRRGGLASETEFEAARKEALAWLDESETIAKLSKSRGLMTDDVLTAALDQFSEWRTTIQNAKWSAPSGHAAQALELPAGTADALVRVGTSPVYRYNPARPPWQLTGFAASLSKNPRLRVSLKDGELVVRDTSGHIRLLIQPGPIVAGLLAPPEPTAPPPHVLTFIERAIGEQTAAGLEQATRQLAQINRLALSELQGSGDRGLAALSLLMEHRTEFSFSGVKWGIDSIRGLETMLELPRGITRAQINKLFFTFAAQLADLGDLFARFNAISTMPGANLLVDPQFNAPSSAKLISAYRAMRARGMELPADMNVKAVRGLLRLVREKGETGAVEDVLNTPLERRAALLAGLDPIVDPGTPTLDAVRKILLPHVQPVRPSIAPADETTTPASIRAQYEALAKAHKAKIDTHVLGRIEASVEAYKKMLRRVQTEKLTDDQLNGLGRSLDGARNEFDALALALERGDDILSYGAPRGAAHGDVYIAAVDVGALPLRGKYTVKNAPRDENVQIDVLSKRVDQVLEIREETLAHFGLPEKWEALADQAPATVDWNDLATNTFVNRKWRQIARFVALRDFADALAREWGVPVGVTRIVVRAETFAPKALLALKNLDVDHEIIPKK